MVILVPLVVAALIVAVVRVHASVPAPSVAAALSRSEPAAAAPMSLPFPTTGQSAVAVPALGVDVPSGPEQPVPIASLTKMMTAYVILHDHPLALGSSGPSITMTQTDVDDFDDDTVEDEANAQVAVGEGLTEYQLLEGLLVHSANNLADTLARWDAGSVPAFVAKMNATAATLGMSHTHYADPSGFDQSSESTAHDLLRVASLDMEDATFRSIVRMSAVTLPVAGTIATYTPLLGFQGVIGVKSGFTTAAGGCDVVAVERSVHGRTVLILAAVTGQVGLNVLATAGFKALNLANHAASSIGLLPVVRAGQVVARVSTPGHLVVATAATGVSVLDWPGTTARRTLQPARAIRPDAGRGSRVGVLTVQLGAQRRSVVVRLHHRLTEPTMWQRLF